jgi:hypothetical protein
VSVLAIVRPDSWDFPLFLHVLGAMAIVGSLVLATICLVSAWRSGGTDALRLGFRALLFGALPGYIVMRVAAQWIYSKEHLDDLPSDPNWVGIGFGVADFTLLLLIVALIVAGVATRRAAAASVPTAGRAAIRVSAGLVALVLVAYLVALWAMTTKPT